MASSNETESKSNDDDANECLFIDDVTLALNSAKSQNKVLIVRCEQKDHANHALWSDAQIINLFAQHCVGLLIQEQTLPFDQFTVLYPVIAFPCLYCINPQNGQVLQCKYGQDVNIKIIQQSIIHSAELIQQQQPQINTNNHNQIVRNAEEAPKKKSVVSKLEQLRKKAKAQKRRKSESIKSTNNNSQKTSPKVPKASTPPLKSAKLNNYNFEQDDTLDAVKFMEITRKNKLRKRKKKKLNLDTVTMSAADTASQRKNALSNLKDEDDVYASTPIMSAAQNVKSKNTFSPIAKKRVRMAFRINNEMDLQHHFNYDDTLIDVMLFVQNETKMTDFIFISQYPPLHIDSAYLDEKKAQQYGLFTKRSADDEKSNEGKYDEIQSKLHKTLYELNLVPSCRIFIQPKFKGAPRSDNGDNAFMKLVYFIFDILGIGFEYGWKGIVYILSILWIIVEMPLNMLGVTNANNANQNRGNERLRRPNRPNSKLKALKKDKRLTGKKSGIQGLRHAENQDDKNKLDNGNSTMYGGDGN